MIMMIAGFMIIIAFNLYLYSKQVKDNEDFKNHIMSLIVKTAKTEPKVMSYKQQS